MPAKTYKLEITLTVDGGQQKRLNASALTALVHKQLADAGLEVDELICTNDADLPADSFAEETQSGVYVCRWPNGECSIVTAPSMQEAIDVLESSRAGHPSRVYPVDAFMADFALTDDGQLQLQRLGDQIFAEFWHLCYPQLAAVLSDETIYARSGVLTPEGRERVRETVERERNRLQLFGVGADEYRRRKVAELLESLSDQTRPN